MSETRGSATGQLQALAHLFADKLPARLEQLSGLWLRYLEGDTAGLARLRQAIHQLKGTAGTYGYLRLADRLRQLEPLLTPADGETLDAGIRDRVDREIVAITETQWRLDGSL